MFPEDEPVDHENMERMQKMKDAHQARKLKLQELQRLGHDEKRATEQEIKLKKQEL